MPKKEECIKNGFRVVWGIGNRDTLNRFCKRERLYLEKVVDVDTALYEKEYPEGFVLDGFEEREREYLRYKLGCRGFVVCTDGSDNPLIDYFVEREKEYWKKARIRGKEKRRESGKFMGGQIPYGYYKANKKLYVEEYESFVVKFCFYRFSQGCGYAGIAKELNLRKFRNRNGNPFKAGSIQNIIENKRLYQGYFTYDGVEVKGDFKGILEDSEELLTKEWKNRVFDEATEAKIAEHAKKYHKVAPNEIRPYIIADDHLDGQIKARRVRRGITTGV